MPGARRSLYPVFSGYRQLASRPVITIASRKSSLWRDSGLPRAYTPELYHQKCSALFEHVYESYLELNAGVHA